MPPKPKVLTRKELDDVEKLAAVMTSEQIADFLGVARQTFYDIMKRQKDVSVRYKRGRAKAVSAVGGKLLTKARDGDTASAIFYLKTQAGWRETQVIEVGEKQVPKDFNDFYDDTDEKEA